MMKDSTTRPEDKLTLGYNGQASGVLLVWFCLKGVWFAWPNTPPV